MKISFCVICWRNDVKLLPKRISDIYGQTVQPDEILIVASGVPDDVVQSDNPDIKIYPFRDRMLPGAARNKGGELATGDVIVFCDVDDPISPQKCEIIKEIFTTNTEVDALVHSYSFMKGYETPVWSTIDMENIEVEKVTEKSPPRTPAVHPHKVDVLPNTNVLAPSGGRVHHGHMSCKREIFNELQYYEWMSLGEDGTFCRSILDSPNYDLYYTPLVLIKYTIDQHR